MRLEYTWKNAADVAAAIANARRAAERERWPRERIEAFQRERLGELVEHATACSAFYRGHYGGHISRHDVRLEQLPPVTKAMMMDHLDDFVTDTRLRRDALDRHLETVGQRDELYLGEYRVMASSGSWPGARGAPGAINSRGSASARAAASSVAGSAIASEVSSITLGPISTRVVDVIRTAFFSRVMVTEECPERTPFPGSPW